MNIDKEIFTPVLKTKRGFEIVSSKIKNLIFEGVLKTGDKLPSEGQLATQFKVGRQTVREALRILELSGFIGVQQGSSGGPYVKNSISMKIADLFQDAFQMENLTIEEFLTARLVIEKAILNNAIDNADERNIKELKDNLERAKDLCSKGESATDINFEFHSLLAKASKNTVFIILEQTINMIHKELRQRNPVGIELTESVIRVHQEILNALIKKKRDKAIFLLEDHIRHVKEFL